MPVSRPALTRDLSPEDFLAFYWLKEELLAFCRTHKLTRSGSKGELSGRIAHYLKTGEALPASSQPPPRATMPETFTRETVIGKGWRCTQALRHFFEREADVKFHFNAFLRDYITSSGVGHTLGEALDGWHASKRRVKGSSPIGEQFEYNRHMRAYFSENPGATRADALKAWKQRRGEKRKGSLHGEKSKTLV